MPDSKQFEGKFDQLRGYVRKTWGQVTDDDFAEARGNMEILVGKIKEKTGESEDSIRRRFNDWMKEDYAA